MSIRAIETTYRGHRFRSRLEARWAVFFDALTIPWEYEPQGYVIDGRPYLPDFRIAARWWVEVKGDETQLDKPFLQRAGEELAGGLIVLGPIPDPPAVDGGSVEHDWYWPLLRDVDGPELVDVGFGHWQKSPEGRMWLSGGGGAFHQDSPWLTPQKGEPGYTQGAHAYAAARSARFEHGQSGATR